MSETTVTPMDAGGNQNSNGSSASVQPGINIQDAPKIDRDQLSLKILQNKTHIGPFPRNSRRIEDLPKSVGKIKINNGLKIELKDSSKESSDKGSKKNQSLASEIYLPKGAEAESAMYYLMAWDKTKLGESGTEEYLKKYQAFITAKIELYASWGFKYVPGKKDSRPELTDAQKAVYTQTLAPLSFWYYEYKLSFKQPKHKSCRSTVYRSLKPLSFESIRNLLDSSVERLKTKVTIKAKASN